MFRRVTAIAAILLLPLAALACSADDDDPADAEPTATVATAEPTAASIPTADPTPNVERVVEREDGAPWGIEDAGFLLDAALLKPADLPSDRPWIITTDNTATNADAVQADPESAESNARCGRVLARTIVSQPEDVVTAFLAAETLAYFSTATVYATADGALDCANETGERLTQPGELARAFGELWVDPDVVTVALADYPAVGDSSFAATLTGQIDVSGTVLDLTVLIVGFRQGNVTAVVGSARSGTTPPAEELAPFVDLVLARIEVNQ